MARSTHHAKKVVAVVEGLQLLRVAGEEGRQEFIAAQHGLLGTRVAHHVFGLLDGRALDVFVLCQPLGKLVVPALLTEPGYEVPVKEIHEQRRERELLVGKGQRNAHGRSRKVRSGRKPTPI